MRDKAENSSGPFRPLIFTVKVGLDWYKASVSKSLEATEGLTREIVVALDAEHLSVCNTSRRGPLKRIDLFVRFSKSGGMPGGTGLGLAISRQICDASGCLVEYSYSADYLHCFSIFWQGARSV